MYPVELQRNEKERLQTVRALQIMDTSPEERFDRITRIAQRLFDVSFAALTIIDKNRQWFKSTQGIKINEMPRDQVFCNHTITQSDTMIVADALQDQRFAQSTLVTNDPKFRFYAGHPLEALNGHHIGTLCIMDKKPRVFAETEVKLLQGLAKLAQLEIAKGYSPSEEYTHESETKFFQMLFGYFVEFSKSMNTPMGVMVVRVPFLYDGKNMAKPIHRDRLLVGVAQILNASVRVSDIVGALDGDAYYILLPKCNDVGLKIVLDRIAKNSSVLQSKLHCSPNYQLKIQKFLWSPTDTDSIEQLVQKGISLLHRNS